MQRSTARRFGRWTRRSLFDGWQVLGTITLVAGALCFGIMLAAAGRHVLPVTGSAVRLVLQNLVPDNPLVQPTVEPTPSPTPSPTVDVPAPALIAPRAAVRVPAPSRSHPPAPAPAPAPSATPTALPSPTPSPTERPCLFALCPTPSPSP